MGIGYNFSAPGGGGGSTDVLDWKESCVVATTGNITLAGPQAVDGFTPANTNRILVWQQANPKENGIYEYNSTPLGAWTRATDFDGSNVTANCCVWVSRGTIYADRTFVLTTNDPITIGGTDLVFTPITGAAGGLTQDPFTGEIALLGVDTLLILVLTKQPINTNDVIMFVNGQVQAQTTDYTVSGKRVTWKSTAAFALAAVDKLLFIYP